MKLYLHLAFVLAIPCSAALAVESQPTAIQLPPEVRDALTAHCGDCHGADAQEGDVRFDGLDQLSLDAQLDLLNRAQDQLFFGLMPPDQPAGPENEELNHLRRWIRAELKSRDASKLDDKIRYPGNGNLVDHDLLFSAPITEKAYTPARRWLVSPQIFHERVIDVFGLTGQERDSYSKRGNTFYGVTNPFLLPERSGVRYFDNESLNSGHLSVMMDNAKWIAAKQIRAARVKTQEIGPNEYPNAKDRWAPRETPVALETIILKKGFPSDEEIAAAIQTQFDRVLRRPADESETAAYLDLTRNAIQVSGNTLGLQQMLVAVLLESEFLYRLEFGAGEPDQFGRQKLSPREASYAISYALGDRGPDPQLLRAAEEGRLNTREDYRREVERLLNDQNYYSGQIDPTLNGKHYRSNETPHPRTVRFFRDFLGYPGALKVFKDSSRSLGKYMNPERGTQGTPGRLVLEADRVITVHVENDQQVFERLLTFDEFFVYHDKDNKAGQQIIEEWRSVYETLKDADWKENPTAVLEANLEFIKSRKSLRLVDASRPGEFLNYMHYFEESFGQGKTPYTTPPWAHGYYLHHAPLYNLLPTPPVDRYGSWKSTEYRKNSDEAEYWDYPTQQPFKIENRLGILTHPAWLIAHSSNFHTDPVRRGRWVREKLLAGRVPDVPITVDAQVPEDPHKSFRQRVELVTEKNECWKCHQQMNPLGYAFEAFDDFGRFRSQEPLEYPEHQLKKGNGKSTFDEFETVPVVTTGELVGADPRLDGQVDDTFDLIDRLVRSDRVRQSIIRHAFRFYLGRNEMPSDAETLRDADRAYVESDGSFQAVIVSLLTSDSFMYRKPQ
ncbi:DUF1588 domain-containing protein [Blastopirellula sp. JC732]|uniref:DUF1588 domain-containing protein n=1 Tax=Blastopirellula sediminis TaxID=2894196 RepID=A0A9X1MJQ2_9BACT|nr:DUF1588 domain-containing protein [Blastopirellula sediminis]MCC9609179.1 DUF1588 domain-containing protein [Blastopirellula sediminis]MCC9628044.1 DUF1588 domain-containing protein [Blastopirellula sediminis]